MTVRFVTYEISGPDGKPVQGTEFFKYGNLAFLFSIFGVDSVFYGKTHWLDRPKGVLFAEADGADDYIIRVKTGYTAQVVRYSPPLDITADIQAGIYVGNWLKAAAALVAQTKV